MNNNKKTEIIKYSLEEPNANIMILSIPDSLYKNR